jgi:3-hydroxy-9,10-secoandrosta-1,3,5(10)-triene-9,17-dione monooxygenase
MRHFLLAGSYMLDANGSGSFADVKVLQRIWRNSNVAARHAVVLPQV